MADENNAVKDIRRVDNSVTVALQGNIDLHRTPEVHKALAGACEDQPSLIVVNLQDVSYIDSSGIGTLVEVLRRVRDFGGKLVLCCVNDRVYNVLEITKLSNIFTMYPTEAEALAQ